MVWSSSSSLLFRCCCLTAVVIIIFAVVFVAVVVDYAVVLGNVVCSSVDKHDLFYAMLKDLKFLCSGRSGLLGALYDCRTDTFQVS